MKSLSNDLTRYMMYVVFSFLAVGISSCSSDDDADDIIEQPTTGSITVQDNQTISQNTIIVQNVTVGQNSWVVAVMGGDENTNNFISEPVMVESGTTANVELMINDDVNLMAGEAGNEISIKLYADNPTEGNLGEWDESDEAIMDGTTLATETITVFVEDSGTQSFTDYDTNADGTLDADEVSGTYQNDFTNWDADGDGSLNEEEFSNTTFANTDANNDDGIDEDEWNAGNTAQYSTYSGENTFGSYDTDANGTIDSDEWMTGYADSTWYSTYDADTSGSVTEDEWNTGLYNDWDSDADGTINEDEYNNYSTYTSSWSNTTETGV